MRTILIITSLASLLLFLTLCTNRNSEIADDSLYLNQNDTVQYVGKETCRLCHSDKYETYMHTGMGLSFDHATKNKSAGIYDEHAIVFDKANNFYYKPFWENDSLMIMEFRIENGDTIHKRIQKISYIIGSGQHTNSHLIDINGYVYQAPITFYAQKKQWDLAPGMEGGFNSRFTRVIEFECMNCHNGLPTVVAGSVNKYQKIQTGIDCERCHGPGSLHIARVSNNILVDTSNEIDYSIVNPKKLSIDLQNQLCMRCHLQGVSVLNDGATFFDFKPADEIKDHWNIFLPRFDGKNDKFLMASQADRLLQSKCFIESHELSCITCHNPHLTVKQTPVAQFNKPCITCHSNGKTECTETIAARKINNDNCSGCHIIKSGSIDIPHVSISDHKIQIPGKEEIKENGQFLGLKCLTTKNPEPETMAEGYLIYYEAFNKDEGLLDSAKYYLDKSDSKSTYHKKINIHYLFLKNNFDEIILVGKELKMNDLDAWTAYRIGSAYQVNNDKSNAELYLKKASELQPYNLDYRYKLAASQLELNQMDKAEFNLKFILAENPDYELAWLSMAFVQTFKGDTEGAEESLMNCIKLNPDQLNARLNLANLYINTRQKSRARAVIDYLESHFPGDQQVILLNQRLKSI